MRITICGGGSLGHVCLGILSSNTDVTLNLLTNHPEKWNKTIIITDSNSKKYEGHIAKCSANPADVIPEVDFVFLCLPGFLIEKTLIQINPYLSRKTIVGSIISSTGFFFFAHKILGKSTPLIGFQRVPFIARVDEYGISGKLLGYKKALAIAVENTEKVKDLCKIIERLFLTPTTLLRNFYEASLTNSNPILHTGRLYSMWGNWSGEIYNRNILFYKEWTIEDSQLLIDMDCEFMQLLDVLPINKKAIPTLLEYYESYNAESLCKKIQSIKAFETIPAPMKQIKGGWIPDFESRYFIEDFPYGLRFICDLAEQYNISTPLLNKVYEWGITMINLHNNKTLPCEI